jgi:hypothetical protein
MARRTDPPARSVSDARVGSGTGRSVADWFALLDGARATRLSHEQIARLLTDDHEVSAWWAQVITVRYEQARGLPSPGLQPDGSYAVTLGRSLRGEPVELLELLELRLTDYTGGATPVLSRPGGRPTAEWTLANGDVLTIAVTPSSGGKCAVALTQGRLRLPERVQPVREALTEALGVMLDRQN